MRTVAWTALVWVLGVGIAAAGPSRSQVAVGMGLRSEGDLVRGQRDTVGFVVTAEQAEDVLAAALDRESPERSPDAAVAVVVPHDDHLYAAGVAVHATEQIRAPVVVLVGVFHAAREWDLEDRLVFDSFTAWHGPWGPVPVDGLRGELIESLGPDAVVVDNAMHEREHSLEALILYLQGGRRDVRIVPVLVPYMGWARMEPLAERFAGVLADAMDARGWRLGRDLAVVISSDAVHYGPDFDHAPFGTDAEGYQRAVERELELVQAHLQGRLVPAQLEALLGRLVDPAAVRSYRIPWCGRFSVPFGLETVRRLSARQGLTVPEGRLLRYGTSISDPLLGVDAATRAAGLGVTAPSNLHHWVGYASVGWWVEPE